MNAQRQNQNGGCSFSLPQGMTGGPRASWGVTQLRMLYGPHNAEVNPEARNFFGVCARRATSIEMNGGHFPVRIQLI